MPVEMKLKQVPAMRGAVWLRQGFRAFGLRPVAMSALLATFLFGIVLLLQVPLLGSIVTIASLPLLSLVFMVATQVALRGAAPTPALFASPFRQGKAQTRALLVLGALYVVGTVFIMLLSHWIDGGRFAQLQDLMQKGEEVSQDQLNAILQDPRLLTGMFTRLGLAALLSVPFWHAPALVHWAGHGAAKSLFSSTLAVWRNRGAFAMYGIACTLGTFALGIVSSLVLALIGQPQLGAMLVVPIGLFAATVFYASLFFTFFDSFEPSTPPPVPEA